MKQAKKAVALVGCGTVSVNHLSALAAMESLEVVALCDVRPERAEAARKEFFPEAEIFTDYAAMLDACELYAVHICTPHYLHAPMTLAALERDIHVFLEKPMAIRAEDIDALLAAEKKSRGRVCVCFQNRFSPTYRRVKEICDADGGVLTAAATVIWQRTKEYYTESGWRGQKTTEGGGVLVNQAIHTVDLLCRFLGTPVGVCATCANHHLKGVNDVEDSSEGVIYFEGGKQACFYATTAATAPHDFTNIILTTKNHTVEMRMPFIIVDNERIEEAEDTSRFVGKACYGSGHSWLIPRFYEALELGEPMPVTLESARAAHDVFMAAHRSNDTYVTFG